MRLRKSISVICFIVLCVQVMPIRQIGAILFKNQITEEIIHSTDCGKKLSHEKETDNFLLTTMFFHSIMSLSPADCGIHSSTGLVQLHYAEVQTPPPNLA